MPSPNAILDGTVTSEGRLVLDEPLTLPPGRVRVVVEPLPELPMDDPFWQMLHGIWDRQRESGFVARTEEEVEAEREAVRNEWEERSTQLEAVQARTGATYTWRTRHLARRN